MRRTCLPVFVLVVLASLLLSCASPATITKNTTPTSGLPVVITDQTGRTVKIEKIPERIVSLAPGNTEILFALGLSDKLVGVTDYDDYPPEARQKPSIGGFSTPNLEKVVAQSPDLVLAANIHIKEVVPALEKLGLTVLALNPKSVDEILAAISIIGQATGKKEIADQLVSNLFTRIKAVTDKTSSLSTAQRPRVFYVVWHDPLMTVSPPTIIHELIVKAGGTNIAENLSGEYPKITLEAVLQANPQVVITTSTHGADASESYKFTTSEPRLSNVDARRNNRIHEIDGNLTSRPGPRVVEGLELLAQLFQPELFKEKK